jgi:transcription initiation factor IIE alpha subunit
MDRLSRDERTIYNLFVEKAKDKGYCKLAYATIAQYTRINVEIVKTAIRELAAQGLITIERVPDSSNRYWITNTAVPEPEPVNLSVWMPEPKHYLFA